MEYKYPTFLSQKCKPTKKTTSTKSKDVIRKMADGNLITIALDKTQGENVRENYIQQWIESGWRWLYIYIYIKYTYYIHLELYINISEHPPICDVIVDFILIYDDYTTTWHYMFLKYSENSHMQIYSS